MDTKPMKKSTALVIYNADRTKVLAVQRPADDANLPNVWGLPAASLKPGETFEDVARSVGPIKLGVTVKLIKDLGTGTLDRGSYILKLRDYEAEILEGEPKVGQPYPEVTQYQAWKWADPTEFIEAAQKGSLCSQVYLKSINKQY